MSPPVQSLHVAVATPETRPLVWGHPDSCATGFTFLCSPTCAATFHSETTNERSTGRRGTCLLAFPDQLGCEIADGCSIGFAMTEDLVEEAVLHEA